MYMHFKGGRNSSKINAVLLTLLFIVLFFGLERGGYLFCKNSGLKYLKNYSYRDYNHQPQNWGIVQDKNGIIYVANHGGVLEFDGVYWRIIGIPGYATVRSLAIDKTGTIYIGGIGEIGYLAPDSQGTLEYVSLVDQMDDHLKNFSDVWNTHAADGVVYFGTIKSLYRWDSRRIKEWKPDYPIYGTYFCKGELFVHLGKAGLMKMVNDGLELIPGGEKFATAKKIFMIVPYDSRRLLIGTRPHGFFIYDGKTMVQFPTEVDDYLNKKKVYQGIRLSTGDLALATRLGGLVIIDSWGHLKYIFDKTYGLQDENVKYVFEDKQGDLWLCLEKGISKIEYASPISIYDERSGLSGLALSVVRHNNKIYVGSTNGLYYFESPLKFRLIPGISSYCWCLLSIENSILAAADEGVFQVDTKNNTKRKVVKVPSYTLLPSKHYPGRIWCGTFHGLSALFRKNSQWIEKYRLEAIKKPVKHIAEDKNGNLWLATSPGDVLYVDFAANPDEPGVIPYGTSHGLPGGEIYPAMASGHVMFATEKGLFQFDEKSKTFIPDETLGVEFAGGPNSKPVFRIAEDKNKNIWFHSQSRNYQSIPGPGQSFTVDSTPFRRIPLIQVNAIYPDPGGKITWFASFDGLIRYDTTIKKNYQQGFQTLIRKVRAKDKLIFDGYKSKTGKTDKVIFPILEYKDRKLYFEFAAPYFEAEIETRYRCFLEGYDDGWSAWNKDTKRSYTNLDAGLYTFRVQAKNVYEYAGKETEFRFKILPPWYKTWWAFLLYALLLFLVIFLTVRWRSEKLKREKQKLVAIVEERTKEIEEKNQILEEQTSLLKDQSEKLRELDKVKSRFFANISHEFRTPLTLIMGPLEQMLSTIRDKNHQKLLYLMLRNSQRLLELINQLLELSKFESGKMKLQASSQNIIPFLKGIAASFEPIAVQNELTLTFHAEEENITLYFDPEKLEEVVVNLLSNALKFTPPGGKVTIIVKTTGISEREEDFPLGSLNIAVRDTGPGIPGDQLAHIFDRFYQSDSTYDHHQKGSGIGLAIAKYLVELHHGRINIHSDERKGTEFIIQLPMGKEHLKSEEIVEISTPPSRRKAPAEIPTFYMSEKEKEEPEPGSLDTETPDASETGKDIVLVVEDSADVREYIRGSLEPHYVVVDARGGREGIQKAQEVIPDLVIADIMMPGVDGYELCSVLKNDFKTSHIPIILLTAKASEENIIQGLETGADDYITKPFNTRILAARIKNLIDLRRLMQETLKREMTLQPAKISVSQIDKAFLKKLKEVIEQNISDPEFNIDQLCHELEMSMPTLYRKIHALTGESPTDFIRTCRLKRGAELLKSNFGSVLEVAFEVGFSSTSYFTKCFKKKFHQLPSTFRATHLGNSIKDSGE